MQLLLKYKIPGVHLRKITLYKTFAWNFVRRIYHQSLNNNFLNLSLGIFLFQLASHFHLLLLVFTTSTVRYVESFTTTAFTSRTALLAKQDYPRIDINGTTQYRGVPLPLIKKIQELIYRAHYMIPPILEVRRRLKRPKQFGTNPK